VFFILRFVSTMIRKTNTLFAYFPFIFFCLLITAFLSLTSPAFSDLPPHGKFRLWQVAPQEQRVIMSYVIQTPHGQLLVIDGGWEEEAPWLKRFLLQLGGRVHTWFITHQHADHMGALTAILRNPDGIQVDRIYASLFSEAWVKRYEPAEEIPFTQAYLNAIKESGKSVTPAKLGEHLEIDGLDIHVLTVGDENGPPFASNHCNNQSIVLRLATPGTSILFLGDLGEEGGQRLLKSKFGGAKLHSEYVQMAHHGQNGVGRDVYEAVRAKYALWPTPDWLWEPPKSGSKTIFRTAEVRQWMKELGIKKNYVMKDGLVELELPILQEAKK
jgi:beta-lactamase superfamily II metal-dependent hydrolase